MTTTPTAEQLATEFSVVLLGVIGEDQMRTVIDRNKMVEFVHTSCCASHDFCDANMVMLNACRGFDESLTIEYLMESDQWIRLWNDAWAIAKAGKFKSVLDGDL